MFGSAARGDFPPVADGVPSPALRDRVRAVLASWFRLRHRGRRAVTRLQRAVRAGRVLVTLADEIQERPAFVHNWKNLHPRADQRCIGW